MEFLKVKQYWNRIVKENWNANIDWKWKKQKKPKRENQEGESQFMNSIFILFPLSQLFKN